MKEYIVYIKQHYEPITIKAEDEDDAEYQVRNHYHFGEPIDLELTVEEN